MKTKIKRHSRAVLSIVLTLCMLVSCMTVGIIATDAAKVTDSDTAIGAKADSEDDALGAKDDSEALGLDSGDGIHLGIGTSTTTWHGMGSDAYEFTLNATTTIYYTFSVGGGNYGKGNQGNPEANSLESYTYYAIKDNNTQYSISLPAGTYKFKIKGYQGNNTNTLEYQFWVVSSGGGGGETTDYDNLQLYGNFKYGTTTVSDWSTKVDMTYDHTTTSGSDTWDYYYIDLAKSYTHYFRFYYNGQNTSHDFSPQNDGANVTVPTNGTEVGSWRKNNNQAFTFNPNTTEYTLWAKIKRNDDDGLTLWLEKTTYPIAASLSISANPTELTAVNQTSTITVTATDIASGVTNLTYTIYDRANNEVVGSPVTVTNGETSATFTVTPNARVKSYYASVKPTTSAQQALYDEVWTSTDATITNSADQYIPRYTVTFSSNDNSYGTVTAKKADGTALTSGQTVKEGTSVTFTATPTAGNEFVEWDNFDTKATSVTRVIRAATTVQGKFGPKGYSIFYQSDTTAAMTEKSNGWYVSPKLPNGDTFTIKQNFSGKYLNAGGNNDYYKWNTGWMGPDHWDGISDSDWESTKFTTPNSKFYKNDTGKDVYCVYDPSTNRVWVTEDPDGLYEVHVVAKDGTIRYGYKTTADYTQVFGDTTVELVSPSSITGTVDNNAYDGMAVAYNLTANDVRNGVTLKIKTQTKSEYVSQGYYVKGFVVSGYEESFSVLWQEFVSSKKGAAEKDSYDDRNWIHTGYNEFQLTINGYPEKGIEITPVYAKREAKSGDNIRFYVEGFAGEVYKEWGGTLAIDAYSTGVARMFGEYPGQPMINYNGRYVVDLPREGITGITLNNYVWDRIHSNLFYGTSGTATGHEATVKAVNYQTYDFNDFVYLKQVMDASNEDEDIIFSFRHRTNDDHDKKTNSQLGLSTYYVNSPDASPTKEYDYRNGFNTIDVNNSIYQWEDLTDFYGNRVDIFGDYIDTKDSSGDPSNPKAAYTNPIRIVSNGYDYNKAGNYATAWALYEPVDASDNPAYTGAFDHYKLIDVFGGQGIVNTDYSQRYDSSSYLINPDFQENLRWKYDQAYNTEHSGDTPVATFVYDLAKVPTVISYEYQVKDGFSNRNLENGTGDGEPAYRSDGRWFTTSSDQLLTAHTIIEYAERDEESLYHRDYYQGGGIDYTSSSGYDPTKNTGLATGIQAYFENDDTVSYMGQDHQNTSGNTQAYAMSDGEHEFLLKAEDDPNGEYVFKGWYMYTNGKYSLVSRSQTYPSEATANDVYVARYYKVPSGTLNISHLLSSDSKGTAKCEVKAEILGTDGTTVEDSNSYPYTEGSLRITNKHIKKSTDGHSKYIRITLKTSSITGYFDEFEKNINDAVSALTTSDNLGIDATVTIDTSGNDKTATITFPIDSLFNSDGNQTTKSLPFYSKIGTYKYSLRFDFQGYRNLYGNLGYDVAETEFTAKELEDYFVLSDSVKDTNNDTVTAYTFKDDDARNAFINLKAPYENTFMETVKWQTDMYGQEHPEGMTATYSSSNHKWSFVVKLKKTDDRFAFVKLRFPYAVKNYDPDKHAPQTSTITIDDKSVEAVAKLTNNEYVEFGGRSTTTTNYRTGYGANYFISGSYVTAANKVWNTTENRWEYFDYWKVENVGDSKTGSAEYTRCYYPEFNLSLYQDSILTPIYTTRAEGMTPSQRAAADDNARIDTYSTGGRATITMMENSRMQWTGGRPGNTLSGSYVDGGDRIYTDFLVSYTYGDQQLNTDTTGMKGGIVIETVRDLDSNENGYYTKTQAEYKTSDDSTINKANIKAFIDGGANSALLKTEFNVTTLDNKNRKNQYYSLPNISQTSHNPTERKNKLYRAYSYLKDASGNVLLISDPIYFTIYDIASIENMSAGAEYGGVS